MVKTWRSSCGRMELRLGKWQDVLGDVTECDAVITDPPYSERTHKGQRHGRREHGYRDTQITTRGLGYAPMRDEEIGEAVGLWSDRSIGWLAVFCSHDSAAVWERCMLAAGRYVFAPLAAVQTGMNVRLAGDGPSNWTTWIVVSRPRTMAKWGTLPGAYVGTQHTPGVDVARGNRLPGAKPFWLMHKLVRDYSRPGDLIVDPYAGSGTTLLAAATEGRRCIGAEMKPETFELAVKRLSKGYTERLFRDGIKGEQLQLGGKNDGTV